MRHVFETMGTVVSLEVEGGDPGMLASVESILSGFDRRYSLWRPESELSRVAAASLSLIDSSEDLHDTYARALEWRTLTGGAFTPNRPDGVVDLNGIVKAEAIRECGEFLQAAGCPSWSLCVGGDILVSGAAPDGSPWSVGIADPIDRARLACSVQLTGSRRAVATSGSAERGDHIWLAAPSSPFIEATVVADDIVTADVLATAIIAGGQSTLDDITSRWDVDVFTVDRDGGMLATPGLRAALAAA